MKGMYIGLFSRMMQKFKFDLLLQKHVSTMVVRFPWSVLFFNVKMPTLTSNFSVWKVFWQITTCQLDNTSTWYTIMTYIDETHTGSPDTCYQNYDFFEWWFSLKSYTGVWKLSYVSHIDWNTLKISWNYHTLIWFKFLNVKCHREIGCFFCGNSLKFHIWFWGNINIFATLMPFTSNFWF